MCSVEVILIVALAVGLICRVIRYRREKKDEKKEK